MFILNLILHFFLGDFVVESHLKYFDLVAISETTLSCDLFYQFLIICPPTQKQKDVIGSLCVTFFPQPKNKWFPDLGIA